jgi:hypothetical protein
LVYDISGKEMSRWSNALHTGQLISSIICLIIFLQHSWYKIVILVQSSRLSLTCPTKKLDGSYLYYLVIKIFKISSNSCRRI